LIGDAEHFWQKRYYDFNIRNYPQFVEKLRYIHRNPVKAGLCERPEDWEWNSFRHCATGCEGRVEIESEWTARGTRTSGEKTLSSDRTAPLKPKPGLSGPPRHLAQLHIGGGWPILAFFARVGISAADTRGVCFVRWTHPWCAPYEHRGECGSLICLRSRHFRSEGWPARLKPGRPRSVKSKRAGVPAPHDQKSK